MRDAPVRESSKESAKGQQRLDAWPGSADFHSLNAAYKRAMESKPKWETQEKKKDGKRR
jgi:hypothetical protein